MARFEFCPKCGTKLVGPRKYCAQCDRFFNEAGQRSTSVLNSEAISAAMTEGHEELPSEEKTSNVDAFGVKIPLKPTEEERDVEAFGVKLSAEHSESPNIAAGVLIFLIIAIFLVSIISFEGTCSSCGGDGTISSSYYDRYGSMHATIDCPVCGGTGVVTYSYGFLLWFLFPLLFIGIIILAVSRRS